MSATDVPAPEVLEGEILDAPAPEQPAPGAELEVAVPSREVLMPMDTEQVVEGMRAYQDMLPKLLTDADWQGKPGAKGSFVKKSGWRKIARAFNLSVVRVSEHVERDPDGHPVRASACYRAIAPNGQMQDGDGHCDIDEPRFSSEGARHKVENDLRGTATTRAKNRAISDLVGMGAVSAEEMEKTPPFGPPCEPDDIGKTSDALVYLAGDQTEAAAMWKSIQQSAGGYMPELASRVIRLVANHQALKAKA